jgi:hypothetical protein
VSDLVKASRAMRCYSKVSSSSPLFKFTDSQDDLNDFGDGGGAPVYKWISMSEFGEFLICFMQNQIKFRNFSFLCIRHDSTGF